LPMAMAAMANSDEELRESQYKLLELWQQTYQGELLIMLPDTFGTTQFLEGAPEWVANWTGQRIDSKNPFVAGDEYITWLEKRGRDPRAKRLIASDGLDVDSIVALHAYFGGSIQNDAKPAEFRGAADFADPKRWLPEDRIRFSSGWGTYLTNDFRDCNPHGNDSFNPVSLVCKLSEIDGRPAVKLSDNYQKAMGPAAEIERYRRVFGTAGVANVPVSV
jgi:nicotinate phosphoribosyltransferase